LNEKAISALENVKISLGSTTQKKKTTTKK